MSLRLHLLSKLYRITPLEKITHYLHLLENRLGEDEEPINTYWIPPPKGTLKAGSAHLVVLLDPTGVIVDVHRYSAIYLSVDLPMLTYGLFEARPCNTFPSSPSLSLDPIHYNKTWVLTHTNSCLA